MGETETTLESSSVRILLVEDFKPYRSLVLSLLSRNPDLNLTCEVEDGLEAVAQAQQVKPDVILLDISLPRLNGLEAARQISGLVPSAKIVFLTQEMDVDVVKEAFSLGAWGYVLKQDAETDLLSAVAAVVRGRQFVSRGLGYRFHTRNAPD